jgi:pimeloyl-ACP methyl ester carboxylesterase
VGAAALARDLLRPFGWRDTVPSPDSLEGQVVFPKDRSVTSFDGTRIAYTVLGDGGPWVACCAGFGCTDSYWAYLGPALDRDHRVIVWDLRGLGASGMPRQPGYRARKLSPEDFAIEAVARDLAAIFDAEGVDRATLVGHSMGGQTILEAHHLDPQRVAGLVFVTAPYETPLRTFYGRDIEGMYRWIERVIRLLPRPAALLWRAAFLAHPPTTHRIGKLVRALGPRGRLEDMAPYYRHMGMLDPLVLLKMAEAMHAHSGAEELGRVRVPTLVVSAALDMFAPPALAERMRERMTHAEHVEIEDAAHAAIIERHEEVDAAVRDFLVRHDL